MSRKRPTLDEFIEYHLGISKPVGYVYSNNAYVTRPGFRSLYVRFAKRDVLKRRELTPVLDIANVEAVKPGKGFFTALIWHLTTYYPDLHVYVECVLNERFRRKLTEDLGFVLSSTSSFDNGDAPSYILIRPIKTIAPKSQ